VTILKTEAGHQKARNWQENLVLQRAEERLIHFMMSDSQPHKVEERHCSWVEGYTEWLEGKEARGQYYAFAWKRDSSTSKAEPPVRPRPFTSGPSRTNRVSISRPGPSLCWHPSGGHRSNVTPVLGLL
jgi:hypothetical protein